MPTETMFLQCRLCGQKGYVAKRVGSGFFASASSDMMDAFFREHENGRCVDDDPAETDRFDLVYE